MLDAFSPQAFGHIERINLVFLPPLPLITCRMVFTMVNGAKRHGEFVTDLQRKPPRLRIANVMGVGWGAAADQAGLLGDKA